MFETADSYLDDYRLYDPDMKAPVGFTEDDAAAVAALPGVEALLAARCADMVLETADEPRITATARVMGTLGTDGFLSLNRFRLTDGRMPERADECVVQTTAGRYTPRRHCISGTCWKSRGEYRLRGAVRQGRGNEADRGRDLREPMSIRRGGRATAVGFRQYHAHGLHPGGTVHRGHLHRPVHTTLEAPPRWMPSAMRTKRWSRSLRIGTRRSPPTAPRRVSTG